MKVKLNIIRNHVKKQLWRLVTVIRGGAATPPNKDFIKTKQHHVFISDVDRYDVRYFSFYDVIVRLP